MKWRGTKNIGMLLLAIWLIATGATAFVNVNVTFANMGLILSSLAIAAGVLILLDR